MSKSVLFVCLGNICRSPTGEGVFRSFASQAGHDLTVESAGTIGYHAGQPADRRMQAAAGRRGYELCSRARQVEPADLQRFDLIVAMDQSNLHDLQAMQSDFPGSHEGTATIKLLSDFLPDKGAWPRDVPDPYYGGEQGFEKVLDMIEAACPKILQFVASP